VNLAAVMAEVAGKLSTLTGLRIYSYPPDLAPPPCAVVGYPNSITFDVAAGRGVDRMELPVYLLVDRNWDRATTGKLSEYTAGAGASSFKQLLQAKPHTAFSTARVASVTLSVITVAGVDLWAATFLVEITGPGGA
jgi:hypothetical protein